MDDREQIRDVYAVSAARLVAQLFAVTGDYAEAQDVVQEAFVRALAKAGRVRELDNPEAWLRTVALNLARTQHRRRVLLDRILRSGRLDRRAGPPELSSDHVALVAALQRLPRPTREAVVLHHIGDLPVAAVATALGCSVTAVKSRLKRGRQALAEHLTDTDPPRPPAVPVPRAVPAIHTPPAGTSHTCVSHARERGADNA